MTNATLRGRNSFAYVSFSRARWALGIRMVTTGGAEGETERKRKFVAWTGRVKGREPGGRREEEWEETERETEKDRMSFRGRLISLSTRLPVSLCPRLFVSLFCSTSCARKFESVTLFATRPLPVIYICNPLKLWASRGRHSMTTINRCRNIFLWEKENLRN